jgi:hypothetical protein
MITINDAHGNEIKLSEAQLVEYHEWLAGLIGRQGRLRGRKKCSMPENLARGVAVAALKKELEVSRARLAACLGRG